MMLIGQMTTQPTRRARRPAPSRSGPTRTSRSGSDAGEDGITGSWDASDAERMADRMQARIESHAPGFASRILARRVLTPRDLEARDANLVGGSLNGGNGGSAPAADLPPDSRDRSRATTPVRGLFLASASAHPGGGVHGACGMNAARAALAHARLRRAR